MGSPSFLLLRHQTQPDHQRFLVPLDPALLLVPPRALGREPHVKGPEHAREDEAHLEVCETV